MPSRTEESNIPGPPPLPIIGNLLDFQNDGYTADLIELGKKYYPIYQLTFGGSTEILINSVELANEVCDEGRFSKAVIPGLEQLRTASGAGLFTARNDEPEWEVGHRILAPVFGPTKIRDMFDHMYEVVEQMSLKWERYGSTYPIEVASDFSRVTLDTIALCGMGFRFNSFYRDGTFHPFVDSMNRWLKSSERIITYPKIVTMFNFRMKREYQYDIRLMRQTCTDIIQRRRKDPSTQHNDLLDALLNGVDPTTDARLSEKSIIDNLITFLIAGHETTAGMLSFTFYYLASDPKVQRKVQEEVDRVYASGKITVNDLSKLPYITAVLRESLRLNPTAPQWAVAPHNDDTLGGKWPVKKGQPINVILHSIHRDPAVYGPNAHEFDPDRMFGKAFEELPANAWKPFGNGKRGCIGRAFAWQEALLITSFLLHKFNFTLHDPEYTLHLQEALTVKPKGCKILAQPRNNGALKLESSSPGNRTFSSVPTSAGRARDNMEKHGEPLLILYGSNSGTCEAVGRQLQRDIELRSSYTCTLADLDSYAGRLPLDHPVLILTGSYDGNPPGNASKFFKWLQELDTESLKGVSYAVLGCGHKDWRATLYKIPTTVDRLLEHSGARRLSPLFKVDTATEDAFLQLGFWESQHLWAALDIGSDNESSAGSLRVFLQDTPISRRGYSQSSVRRVDLQPVTSGSSKVLIDLEVPQDMSYSVGDSLSVLPLNPKATVQRVLSCFHLAWDTYLKLESESPQDLPTDYPVSVSDLLGAFVELGQTATPSNIKVLARATAEQSSKKSLLALAEDSYQLEIADQHVSVLHLLERFPDISISIETYLGMVPLMRPRVYSIASDPEWTPGQCSLVATVIDGPHWSGHGQFLGVASNHLADLLPGSRIRVSVKQTNPHMRLPPVGSASPVIMIAAGSGIAPFRGFIQQRAIQARQGQLLGRALLFYGCRKSDEDDLYRQELNKFELEQIVQVKRAFSREPDSSESNGSRYVQDRLLLEKQSVLALWTAGASVYVCGGVQMAQGVRSAINSILQEAGVGGEELLVAPRYVAEIFT